MGKVWEIRRTDVQSSILDWVKYKQFLNRDIVLKILIIGNMIKGGFKNTSGAILFKPKKKKVQKDNQYQRMIEE